MATTPIHPQVEDMIHITAVHMVGGELHEHIASVRWRNPTTTATGESTRQQVVDWIRTGGEALVALPPKPVKVGVVDASPPYIRTHADGAWTNNLLALPHF